MTSHFQAFSPSYENISNRISRLRHNSQNHHNPYAASCSPHKPLNLFTVQTKPSLNHRPVPSSINLHEDPFTNGKFTGRINRNVGLKKYNQRQLKEVMTANKEPTYLKTEGNSAQQNSKVRLCTEGSTVREFTDFSNMKTLNKREPDEVLMNQEQGWSNDKTKVFQTKLVPGKMYKREYLMTLLNH